jgi:hypothetical protein
VARFGVLRGMLQIAFVNVVICLSSFFMSGIEYGIAWKLYSTPSLSTVFTILIFCFIVFGEISIVCFD